MNKINLQNIEYYNALTGSRRCGINIESSDTDYIILVSCINAKPHKNFQHSKKGNIDYHYYTSAKFIDNIFITENFVNPWYTIGVLFSIPTIETDFSKYLLENREILIRSNMHRFGNSLLHYATALSSQGRGKRPAGKIFSKRTIYAMIFLNAYINYATKNITFEEAFKLSDEMIDFIKGIRLGTVPYEIQMEKLNSMLEEANLCKGFYDKEPDLITFNKIKNDMKALLNIN